jgi:3-hydroxymyristoyl/3-hydroxydecanoyl-(acyl carrier protein) dehydratase
VALLAEVEVKVAASHGGFLGHFPEDPVLPGVVLLDLVASAVRGALGPDRWLSGIPWLRWRAVVRPGDDLRIQLHGAENGDGDEVAFEVRRQRDHALVSQGTLRIARSAP